MTDIPNVYLDDNVFDPITRKGQENICAQFIEECAKCNLDLRGDFKPCYSVFSFFERLGDGTICKKIKLTENLSIPSHVFDDRVALAVEVEKLQLEIVKRIEANLAFSREHLKQKYESSLKYIGNIHSDEFLNSTYYHFGSYICGSNEYLTMIIPYFTWDRLVAFPVAELEMPCAKASRAWEQAERYYDILFAVYHNSEKIRESNQPFPRLLLQRLYVNSVLKKKSLEDELDRSNLLKKIAILSQIFGLDEWLIDASWMFKKESDLGDVMLVHFALYGKAEIINGEITRVPVHCITCDRVETVQKRLYLCKGAHDQLCRQVKGWNLSLLPGKISCFDFENRKFTHVKTIDVQIFFNEQEHWRSKLKRINFRLKIFTKLCKWYLEECQKTVLQVFRFIARRKKRAS